MPLLPIHLSVLTYTRNIQLYAGLLYFLTVVSICVWCVVLASTIVRSFYRHRYSRSKLHNIQNIESQARTPE